jgi:hypothetical protein
MQIEVARLALCACALRWLASGPNAANNPFAADLAAFTDNLRRLEAKRDRIVQRRES